MNDSRFKGFTPLPGVTPPPEILEISICPDHWRLAAITPVIATAAQHFHATDEAVNRDPVVAHPREVLRECDEIKTGEPMSDLTDEQAVIHAMVMRHLREALQGGGKMKDGLSPGKPMCDLPGVFRTAFVSFSSNPPTGHEAETATAIVHRALDQFFQEQNAR